MGDKPNGNDSASPANNKQTVGSESNAVNGAANEETMSQYRAQQNAQQIMQHYAHQAQYIQFQMANQNSLRNIAPRMNGTPIIVSAAQQMMPGQPQRQFQHPMMLHPQQGPANGMPVVIQGGMPVPANFFANCQIRPDGHGTMLMALPRSNPSMSSATTVTTVPSPHQMQQRQINEAMSPMPLFMNADGSVMMPRLNPKGPPPPSSSAQPAPQNPANSALITQLQSPSLLPSQTPVEAAPMMESQPTVEEILEDGEAELEDTADDVQELPPALDRACYDESDGEKNENEQSEHEKVHLETAEMFLQEAEEFRKKTAENPVVYHKIDGWDIEECDKAPPLFSGLNLPMPPKENKDDSARAEDEPAAADARHANAPPEDSASAAPVRIPAKRGRRRKQQPGASVSNETQSSQSSNVATGGEPQKKRGRGRRPAVDVTEQDQEMREENPSDDEHDASYAGKETAHEIRRRSKRGAAEEQRRRSNQEQHEKLGELSTGMVATGRGRNSSQNDDARQSPELGDEPESPPPAPASASPAKAKTTPPPQSQSLLSDLLDDSPQDEFCINCNESLKKARLRKNPQYCKMACRNEHLRNRKLTMRDTPRTAIGMDDDSSRGATDSPVSASVDESTAGVALPELSSAASSSAHSDLPPVPSESAPAPVTTTRSFGPSSPPKLHSVPNKPLRIPPLAPSNSEREVQRAGSVSAIRPLRQSVATSPAPVPSRSSSTVSVAVSDVRAPTSANSQPVGKVVATGSSTPAAPPASISRSAPVMAAPSKSTSPAIRAASTSSPATAAGVGAPAAAQPPQTPPTPAGAAVAQPQMDLAPGWTVPTEPANENAVPVPDTLPGVWTVEDTFRWVSRVVGCQETASLLKEAAYDGVAVMIVDIWHKRNYLNITKYGPKKKLRVGIAYLKEYHRTDTTAFLSQLLQSVPALSAALMDWSVDNVRSCLTALRCSEDAIEKLHGNGMDGQVLKDMDVTELVDDLELRPIDAIKIFLCIQHIKEAAALAP